MKKCFIYSLVFFFTLVYTITLSSGVAYAKKTGPDHSKTVTLPYQAAKGKGNKKGHEGKTYDELYAYLYDDESRTEHLASAGASVAMFALLQSMGVPGSGFISNKVTGLIMPLIFGGGDDPQADILDKLNTMNATLTHIEGELKDITDLLKGLEQQLAIDTAKIVFDNTSVDLNDNISAIDSVWENYRYLYDSDNDEWTTSKDKLENVMQDTLDSDKADLHSQLVAIHEVITGENFDSPGALHLLAVELALKVNAFGEPLLHYHLLESYFGMVLQAETRAATLMVESLHYREASSQQPESGVESYDGTAEFFMNRHIEKIDDQVESFLNAVEYFVTNTADPRKGLTDFVPDADTIFLRADLTAAFLSNLHRPDPDSDLNGQRMIVYRVIGSPIRVAEYGDEFNIHDGSPGGVDFSSMLYKQKDSGEWSYDIPTYELTDYHSWSDIQNSPYVQFHPGVLHGLIGESGVISSASEIWIGKYYTEDILSDNPYVTFRTYMLFNLQDFAEHEKAPVVVKSLNSNGEEVKALWSTHTQGNPGAYYMMQDDGNFVIYSEDDEPLWATGTYGYDGAYYEMRDDGNFVILSEDGKDVLWESGTDGHTGAGFTLQSDGNFVIFDNKNNTHIYYDHVLDIQHPPALLRGHWLTAHYHNYLSSDLGSVDTLTTAGVPTDTNDDNEDWVNPSSYLHVNAWPYISYDQYREVYCAHGSFLQEFANKGWYKWVGSGSPTLEVQLTADIERTNYVTSRPGTHSWGTHFRVANHTTDSSEIVIDEYPYYSGTETVSLTNSGVAVNQDNEVYILVGPRMDVDWQDTEFFWEDDVSHWNKTLKVTLTDLQLILQPQQP